MSYKSIPLISVQGSNYEIGLQYGQQAKEQIKDFSRTLLLKVQRNLPGTTKKKALSYASRFIPYVEDVAPHLIEEMKGIANGAGLSHEEIFFLNVRNEIMHMRNQAECTSFGLIGSETSDGEAMIGQTIDSSADYEKNLVLLRLVPKKGPSMLMCTRAGASGFIGINSYGVARVGNGLSSKDHKALGVPNVIVNRLALEQRSIDDALSMMRNVSRMASNNHIYADFSGNIIDIEMTPYEDRTIEPNNGFVYHANHYEHPDLLKYDTKPTYSREGSSRKRSSRIKQLIANEKRPITEDAAKNWMKDHEAPICRHTSEGELGGKTITSVILRPIKRLMHVCLGNPCEGVYYTFKLKDSFSTR